MNKSIFILTIILLILTSFKYSEKEQITIPLSDPHARGILIVKHQKGSINIQGYDGAVVVIDAIKRYETNENIEIKDEGLKKIPTNNFKITATEEDNQVLVRTNSFDKTVDLDIQVPYSFDLKLNTIDNGDITVNNISGTMEVSNVDGDITIKEVSGSVIANTVDGNIVIVFNSVTENTPMAFSTVDGKIDVTFPANINALLKMKSDYGDVFSDFEIELIEHKQNIEKNNKTGVYKVVIEEWTYGKINNGGTEILLKSLDGNIYIRKGN